jgi:hypothetical protein
MPKLKDVIAHIAHDIGCSEEDAEEVCTTLLEEYFEGSISADESHFDVRELEVNQLSPEIREYLTRLCPSVFTQ